MADRWGRPRSRGPWTRRSGAAGAGLGGRGARVRRKKDLAGDKWTAMAMPSRGSWKKLEERRKGQNGPIDAAL
ncbi:hypothetical protein GUJ93_ZPchr0004g40331 [Zizania palustris]|uniref:Uncharacterized protein n=1 Tax=Zizania palustris TaxID=103762 RepID=A0A8J5VZU3_ZIZPA|nr:hypothetical protein GUJ93_ZPchr0004g40331 [Zizania palustris]